MESRNRRSKSLFTITDETQGKILAFVIVVFPILFVYRTSIPSITLADILLIVSIIICLPKLLQRKVRVDTNSMSSFLLFLYLFLVLVFELFYGYKMDIVMKYARYLLYIFTAVLLCPRIAGFEYSKKMYKVFGCITSALIIIQYIGFYVFGRKISGYIPFLPLMGTNDWQTLQSLDRTISIYRPCSMFSEPAHYGAYAAGCLGISLGDDDDPLWFRILLTMGLLLSTSSTAIICGAVLWLIWMIRNKKLSIRNSIIIVSIVIVLIVLLRSTSMQYAFDRVFGTGMGVSGRFDSYSLLFEDINLNGLTYILGHGFTYELKFVYLPGWGAFFYCFGIVGLVLLVNMMLQICLKAEIERKTLIMILCLLSVGTLSLVSYNFMLYVGLATFGLASRSPNDRASHSYDVD